MGGGLESRCIDRGYDRSAPSAPYTRPTQQKTICCNSPSNDPDDGRMYPQHVELRMRQ